MGRIILITLGLLASALVAAVVGFLVWEDRLNRELKAWDARMDALCAANGGADVADRIYETAVAPLTKEYFAGLNPPRSLFIAERSEGRDLGARYPYVYETRVLEVLNEKDPRVLKYTERIVRVSDNKILAERFGYQRSGGGLPMFDPSEIRNCPDDRSRGRLDVQVFVNHPQYERKEAK